MRAWHAVIAGGFLVAWLTGDNDDFYMMHQVAGYTVLVAVAARLLVGLFATKMPWRLPRPSLAGTRRWLAERRGRNPLFGWLAVALFATVGASAGSGMAAHWLPSVEDLHGGLTDAALWVIGAHVAFVVYMFAGLRRMLTQRLRPATVSAGMLFAAAVAAPLALTAPTPALAGDAEDRQAILDTLAEEARAADPAFNGFDAAAGETLFRTRWAGGDERTPSCTACHTEDPRATGRNAKTGRPIEPVAVSVNPDRFTDPDEVAKQFHRDCDEVLGRECTAQEKGDYITFMMGQ
ncbi:DUF1924 domain-containing protein [Roseospira navarrensis]|uniref:DUF1924 domain-containing protein n=2 Tax=Roseospira navarrensis TaxID=140058 RepID=A0A7X2D3L3_9PROT|nr:DUF1924 domain-containing protein [Roseospira navarrensis]